MTNDRPPETLTMSCPGCETAVGAASDSSGVIAWFTCPACGHDWSVRLRNGRPQPGEDAASAEALAVGLWTLLLPPEPGGRHH